MSAQQQYGGRRQNRQRDLAAFLAHAVGEPGSGGRGDGEGGSTGERGGGHEIVGVPHQRRGVARDNDIHRFRQIERAVDRELRRSGGVTRNGTARCQRGRTHIERARAGKRIDGNLARAAAVCGRPQRRRPVAHRHARPPRRS